MRQPAIIQSSVFSMVIVVALAPAKADDPHTFSHAAQEAGFETDTAVFPLSGESIQNLDGVKDFSAAERINLYNNQITSIPDNAFSGLSGLQDLFLNNNQITSIPSSAFSGLLSLQYLSLDRNQIATIAGDTFLQLSDLKYLRLERNQITSIANDAFYGISSLQSLALDGNQITSIPNAFSELSSLQSLDLGENQITSIHGDVFAGLSRLEFLNLWRNEITSISSDAFAGLSSLQMLRLQDNQISEITSDTFSGLASLQFLGLSNNHLSRIPADAFSGLSSLQILNLRNNQINTIPNDTFSGLSSLQTLRLESNKLTDLNFSGATFQNLRDFEVHGRNTIASVDLSRATLSQTAFEVIVQDLDNGDVLALNLSSANLTLVTSYSAIKDWDDLQTIDLSFATLGSNEIDFLTDNLTGLNDLTISRDQWNNFPGKTQDNLNSWNAIEVNTLTVIPEPGCLTLVILGLLPLLSRRRRHRA